MKVSILVPVYVVEKYIERCAVSLFEQTYSDIEYIFVDDCSPDRSIEILQEMIKRYPDREAQVRIIRHEQNRGLSGARATAIKAATGDFLMHVDSDDWIERNAVELCVERQKETEADYVYFDIVLHHRKYDKYWLKKEYVSPHEMALAVIRREAPVCVWGGLIRTAVQRDHGIYPEVGVNMGEDYQQTPRILYYSKRVAHLAKILYHYDFTNDSSYCNSDFSDSKYRQASRSFQIIYDFCQGKGNDMEEAAEIAMLKLAAGRLIKLVTYEIRKKEYQECLDKVRRSNRNLWKNVPLVERVAMHLQNIYLVAAYVKLLRPVKHLLLWGKEQIRR